MDCISKLGCASLGAFCVTVGAICLPSDASQVGAQELRTAPVSLSTGSNAIAKTGLGSSEARSAQEPTFSFSKQPVGNLSVKASQKSAAAPFRIAQTAPPAEPSAPVNVDVQSPQQLPTTEQVTPTKVDPGRSTRSGSSYIGVGANIGVLGDPSIGETGLMVYSKVGLTRYFSIRPAVTTNFVDNATFILPATFDLAPIRLGSIAGNTVSIAPYVGAGAAVNTDGDVGPLLTGGIDVPINSRLTATVGVNAGFLNNTDLGTFVGVGYNF
jgi:hypothetical protein